MHSAVTQDLDQLQKQQVLVHLLVQVVQALLHLLAGVLLDNPRQLLFVECQLVAHLLLTDALGHSRLHALKDLLQSEGLQVVCVLVLRLSVSRQEIFSEEADSDEHWEPPQKKRPVSSSPPPGSSASASTSSTSTPARPSRGVTPAQPSRGVKRPAQKQRDASTTEGEECWHTVQEDDVEPKQPTFCPKGSLDLSYTRL
ncbi:hypothetical protein DPEC_G00006410 [Dallia pectoralis]|uniref:Uncharacterized protein n=1 Tax=Dallia pectoralis TaxID=75939 RepID=A0ACC2HK11_DALPE|nr:hypothetical protein DPEC_G00006410 [Dallia pectoralis]